MKNWAYDKAVKRFNKESVRQCLLIYSATGIVLYRYYGKKKQAIDNFFNLSLAIWNVCAKDNGKSMVEMCEKETGIEVQNGEGKSWRDLPYMNIEVDMKNMSYEQWTYMRIQQAKWIAPQIMSCFLITAHRKYGFGFERCAKFYAQVGEVEREFNMNEKVLMKACEELTGIDVMDVVTVREVDR